MLYKETEFQKYPISSSKVIRKTAYFTQTGKTAAPGKKFRFFFSYGSLEINLIICSKFYSD